MTTAINGGHPFLAKNCRDAGMTSGQLYEARNEGAVRRILDRVFVDSGASDSRELRIEAMKLIAPEHAVVSDDWASWIYGVDTFAPSKRHSLTPSLVVPHGQSRIRIDDLACRQALIKDEDILTIEGLNITTPVRTTADLLRKKWRPHALSATDSMAHAELVTMEEVWDFVVDLKGYRGIRQARNLALLIEPRAASPGESWTRLRVIDAGFAIPEPQFEVVDRDGTTRYLDLAYPELMIAVEFDGAGFHTTESDKEHDRYRRTLITALGFRVIVAESPDIFGDDATFERTLGALLGMAPLDRKW
ncbi:hypothetical protein [Aeromicrobium sp.]